MDNGSTNCFNGNGAFHAVIKSQNNHLGCQQFDTVMSVEDMAVVLAMLKVSQMVNDSATCGWKILELKQYEGGEVGC